MTFSNYADFRNKVQVLLDGDDISTSELSVDVLDVIIGVGEQRIYRELHASCQDTSTTLAITSNVATLPSDFIELRGAPYVSTFGVAIYAPWEAVQNQIQLGANSAVAPVYYTFQGDTMIFYPLLGTGVSVAIQYYKKFTDIATGGLNALFNRHPDVFLYAALSASGPILGETTRTGVWERIYTGVMDAAKEQELRRVTRGAKLQTRIA